MARRVLIIEDEDDIRRVAQVSLERIGRFEVLTASSGAEGIDVAVREQPDVVLCDVQMPDLDGPGTLARLHASPATRHIPVIFLTAQVQPHDRRRYLELGATAVIAKPFDPLSLPRAISAALGWESG